MSLLLETPIRIPNTFSLIQCCWLPKTQEIMYSGKTNKLLSSSTSLLRCSHAIWHIAEFCSNFFPSSSWLMGWLTGCCVQQQQQFVNKSRPEQTFLSWHNNFVHVHYITIATRLAYFTSKVFTFLASPNVDANLLFIPWLDFTTWSSRCLHTIMAINKN